MNAKLNDGESGDDVQPYLKIFLSNNRYQRYLTIIEIEFVQRSDYELNWIFSILSDIFVFQNFFLSKKLFSRPDCFDFFFHVRSR